MSHKKAGWYSISSRSVKNYVPQAFFTHSHQSAAQLWLIKNQREKLIEGEILAVSNAECTRDFRIHVAIGLWATVRTQITEVRAEDDA